MTVKERFTKFRKKDLIKMWRTLKAESGDRQTHIMPRLDEASIRQLMNRMEERTIQVRKK